MLYCFLWEMCGRS